MSDSTVAQTLVRVSVGIENWEDLKRDIVEGCKALAAEGN
jgi:cystathionine beta-lyase/cystathionine gamma-synthase